MKLGRQLVLSLILTLNFLLGLQAPITEIRSFASFAAPNSTNITLISEPNYKLPYPGGTRYLTYQGNNGVTHKKKDYWAFDFNLSRNSDPVVAARSGRIYDLREDVPNDQNCWAPDTSCWSTVNYIVVVHEPDDEYADLYLHLAHDSIIPSIGDWVKQGDPIAYADNNGISSNDHLHCKISVKI